ncbi:5'-AMP-activated protein kinase beta subunit, interation domain-containing protein [Astrocystis sublimbata]|nr:5'-AMP-activated protein kinase beta subunit, interation domain-containing protein [Astrocystis sublimbata]
MGNTPSSASKPATPTPPASSSASANASASAGAGADSPRASKREHKEPREHRDHRDHREHKHLPSLHHPHHIRSPASLEASVVQAQGSTISNRSSQTKPLSILNQASPATAQHDKSAAYPRDLEHRPRHVEDVKHEEPEASKPVAVPQPEHENRPFDPDSQLEGLPTGTTSSSIQDMTSYMPRPPRLPLPIEEEVHTPGSPIAAPEDNGDVDDVPPIDEQTGITRRTSGLSNVTDEDDTEELRVDKSRPTIPTRITWLRGGQKVYVTGTPFQWGRKQRLLPSMGEEGVLETVIRVFPGTHHIKFLVDGTMQTSPDLPTTVDFGNNLVNYIEVSVDTSTVREINVEPGVPKAEDAQRLPSRQPSTVGVHDAIPTKMRDIVPADVFSGKLPRYLEDFDQPEESKAYRISATALEKLPAPPTLPSFLSKPIMNNTTLIKDDNSVLNMPNHTVLNHLATCSIRNNVLPLSATTRYKDKYVTTVIYKPSKM